MTDINNKPETVMTQTPVSKQRLKGYDRILAAAKSLPLKDRVELVKELTRVNTEEVNIKQKEFEEAKSLINP